LTFSRYRIGVRHFPTQGPIIGSESAFNVTLVQQADKVARYNQLPPEAEVVRRALLSPNLSRAKGDIQPEQAENPAEKKGAFRLSKQHLLDEHDPNVLLSTNELASLTGFRPKTIRRWVSRKLLNYIRVGLRRSPKMYRLCSAELTHQTAGC
jgi:hypothetical protein